MRETQAEGYTDKMNKQLNDETKRLQGKQLKETRITKYEKRERYKFSCRYKQSKGILAFPSQYI